MENEKKMLSFSITHLILSITLRLIVVNIVQLTELF